jgi:hypothetical protein
MGLVERKVLPEVITNFPALNGFAEQDGQKHAISAIVTLNDNSDPLLIGTGPIEWVSGLFRQYRVVLTSSNGWNLVCENCNNTQTKNHNQFVANLGKVKAIFGKEPDPKSASCFAVFVGGDNKIRGDDFDQERSRTVISLEGTGRCGELYGASVGWGQQEIGYVYLKADGKLPEEDWVFLGRLQMFLSLAFARFIDIPWYGRFDDTGNIQIEMLPHQNPGIASPLLYISYPFQVSKLIKNGWNQWDTRAQGLELPQLIRQYILVRDQQFIESSLMLACVWMEAFKYQYAQNIKKYGKIGDYFLKPGSTKDKFAFKELVEGGMKHFGIAHPYLDFIDIRNEVIHTGTITASIDKKIEVRRKLEQAIEEFFFTVLEFDGYIWDHIQSRWVERKKQPTP